MLLEAKKPSMNTRENVNFLGEGVRGIECLYTGKVQDAPLTDKQKDAVEYVNSISTFPVSTVEVYANGFMNMFIKYNGNTVFYVKWRYGTE